ncbi:13540_t:CDS:2, partial [Dentiscutata erythropus]
VPEQILRDTTMRLAKLRGFCDRHPMYKSSPHIIGDTTTLLREFAIPFELVESELSIVHAIEVNPRRNDIDNIWTKIIRKASQRATDTGSIQPIADIILESAQKFYPHDLRVFPLQTIVRLVATYLIDNRINEPYFITRILRQANVAYGDLFNTYHQLYSNRAEPFNNSQPGGGMELLLSELAYVLNQWIKSADERIHGYISEYLTTVSHFAFRQDLAHEFLEIQRKLEAFSANMFE